MMSSMDCNAENAMGALRGPVVLPLHAHGLHSADADVRTTSLLEFSSKRPSDMVDKLT